MISKSFENFTSCINYSIIKVSIHPESIKIARLAHKFFTRNLPAYFCTNICIHISLDSGL